ncbi:TPA: hypothetical protein DIS56_02195 [Candidatus Saccharibacteria bacterium]|nr:MAG: hypothetical protein UX30_C0003G0088 [Candidatus Saccharibacteria bacterium GW2011_GWA2_46_10]OGL36270.1 MAG: hypothetical protein A3F05_03085 [Candidatus Saccharibacteria bacterium RIFCSPHIGHO2_12_FULL_47_17]HCM51922.1 hypothetical protein [Candidatus Saccharibacteria bacterium]
MYAAEVAYVLGELTDGMDMSDCELLQVHRLAPPEVSIEELRDLAAIIGEAGWNADVAPLIKDGEEIGLGVRIQGGLAHEVSSQQQL